MKKHKSFKAFLSDGHRNEKYVYHIGNLMKDRKENEILSKLADNVLEAYVAGKVNLMQKRYEDDLYHYIAVRTPSASERPFRGCYRG